MTIRKISVRKASGRIMNYNKMVESAYKTILNLESNENSTARAIITIGIINLQKNTLGNCISKLAVQKIIHDAYIGVKK